jgi:hypothetical protein
MLSDFSFPAILAALKNVGRIKPQFHVCFLEFLAYVENVSRACGSHYDMLFRSHFKEFVAPAFGCAFGTSLQLAVHLGSAWAALLEGCTHSQHGSLRSLAQHRLTLKGSLMSELNLEILEALKWKSAW